jgi:diguanylate cyclase (GGDEF)-like protein
VLFFDLDGLKTVNDTLGHEIGSTLLVNFANLLKITFRQSDVIARLGGDEFAVVALSNDTDLIPTLQRLENAVAKANREDRQPFSISYSAGGATLLPNERKTFSEIVEQADALMYERKRQKKLVSKLKM